MMKKKTVILLFMLMILGLAACGNSESVNIPEIQPEGTGTSEVQAERGENAEKRQAEE